MVAGALLFGVDYLRGGADPAPNRVTVDAATVDRLEETFRQRQGRPPSEEERAELIDDHIEEEILVREALKLGLHESDRIVRRRLVQAMRFLTEDMTPIEEPTGRELRAYLEEHRDAYAAERRWTLQHVFIPEADAGRPPLDQRLSDLRDGADWRSMGRPFIHGQTIRSSTRADLAETFGEGFAAAVVDLQEGRWGGPVSSSYGEHLVRVTEVAAEGEVEFEAVADRVEGDWKKARREEANRRAFEQLREAYEVEVESGGASEP